MKIMGLGAMDEEDKKLAEQEINLLKTLEHEHVLSYITCFVEGNDLCIVTEFCPNGDLAGKLYIDKKNGWLVSTEYLHEMPFSYVV